MIRKPYAVWDDLEGLTGTFHVGKDSHDGIETKVVIFRTNDGISYVLAEYQKKIKTIQEQGE